MDNQAAFFELLDIAENHEPELLTAQKAFTQNNPRAAAEQNRMTRKQREQLIIDMLVFLGLLREQEKNNDCFMLYCLTQFIAGKKTAFTTATELQAAMKRAHNSNY